MRASRGFRIFFGLIVLAIFGVYVFFHLSTTPRSSDMNAMIAARGDSPVQTPPTVATEPPMEEHPEPTAEATPEPIPEPTLDPNSPEGRAAALGLPAPPEIDINSWEYVLVNATHVIDENFAPPEIVSVEGQKQDSRIAEALQAFADGCRGAGLPVYLSSGYRSYSDQAANFQRKLNEGYSREQAAKIVAIPGTSEHQTGLCCDITYKYLPLKDPDELGNNSTFLWLNEHCAEYGFILRYPNGEIAITGIMYEPWHFRYVGEEAAAYIKANELTLEEFVALYTGEEVPGAEA